MALLFLAWNNKLLKWSTCTIHPVKTGVGTIEFIIHIHSSSMDIKNPFGHEMAGRLSCEDSNLTNLSDFVVRVFADLEFYKCLLICCT